MTGRRQRGEGQCRSSQYCGISQMIGRQRAPRSARGGLSTPCRGRSRRTSAGRTWHAITITRSASARGPEGNNVPVRTPGRRIDLSRRSGCMVDNRQFQGVVTRTRIRIPAAARRIRHVAFDAGRFVFALSVRRTITISTMSNEMPHSSTRRHPCNDCMEPVS